jgi:hypothetical protein
MGKVRAGHREGADKGAPRGKRISATAQRLDVLLYGTGAVDCE